MHANMHAYLHTYMYIGRPEMREGEWAVCMTTPSMDQNPSWMNIVAHVVWDKFGHCLLVVINYKYEWANGHVILPENVVLGHRSYPLPARYAALILRVPDCLYIMHG